MNYMSSLVYDWLVTAGDEGLAKKFKEEVKPQPLPSNSQRLSDFVKVYLKETNGERTSESRLCQEETRGRGTGEKMADQDEIMANNDDKDTLIKKRQVNYVRAKEVKASDVERSTTEATAAAKKKKPRSDQELDTTPDLTSSTTSSPNQTAAKRAKLSTEDEVVVEKKKSKPAEGLVPASSKPESKKAADASDQEGSRDEEKNTKSSAKRMNLSTEDDVVEKKKKSKPAAGLSSIRASSKPESKKAASNQEGSGDKENSTMSSAPQIEIVSLESSSESGDESSSELQEGVIAVSDVGKKCDDKLGETGKVSHEDSRQEVGRLQGTKQVETIKLESSSEEEEDEVKEIEVVKEVATETASKDVIVQKGGASDDTSRKHGLCAAKESTGNLGDGEEGESKMKNLGEHGGGGPVKKAEEGAKLCVKNLSRDTTIHDLLKAFGEHGTVTNTSFVPGKHYAFVMFSSAAEASNVIMAMNGKKICGHVVEVATARPRPKTVGFKRGRAQSGQWGRTTDPMSGFL